jgi:hypothetical protein
VSCNDSKIILKSEKCVGNVSYLVKLLAVALLLVY